MARFCQLTHLLLLSFLATDCAFANFTAPSPLLSDSCGNVLAVVTNGVVSWNPSRPTGYGAVPGYRPLPLGAGANLGQAAVWRGHYPDITGYIYLGARYYDPVSGSFLSSDPVWNGRDPNYYTFCGGDPINHFDPDGRLGKAFYQDQMNGGAAGQVFQGLAGYLNNYNNGSAGGAYFTGLAGQLVNELAGMSAPNTYVNGAMSFGNNVSTVYHDSGFVTVGSYALTSWNVGAIYSGAANIDLVTGQPVGDFYQRGTVISGGVASTAGIASGGLGLYNWATAASAAAESGLNPGSFSVIDWGNLPEHLRPDGPMNLLETGSDELLAAQRAKAVANDALREDLDLRGVPMDIHEIQPVKFGGSPTDFANKTLVPRDFHQQVVTPFWNQLQRDIGPYAIRAGE
jgi:RHS repeat-associated protein